MTALREFQRLEAAGLWRSSPASQRRDVIVSLGNATLTITDMQDRPLAHWSLAAVARANPGQFPAIFHPDGDPGETLELPEDETTMLEAINKLRSAIERARPHPGRLRYAGFAIGGLAIGALLVFGVPQTMRMQTLSAVSDLHRSTIGHNLLGRIERVTGKACSTNSTAPILARIADRTSVKEVVVLRDGVAESLSLPGGIVLINKDFIEDFEDPAVAVGAVLAEKLRAKARDPIASILDVGGLRTTFHLLTTGEIETETLDLYAENALSTPRPPVDTEALLEEFARIAVPSSPYAYAVDVTGETTLGLIEADPMAGRDLAPALNDRDWVTLQNICS